MIRPYDLVELADALEAWAAPHLGSAWSKTIADDYGLPMTTPRQEEIIKDYLGGKHGLDAAGSEASERHRKRLYHHPEIG